MMKNQKKDEPLRANFAAFENVSYHLNATPLSVAKGAKFSKAQHGVVKFNGTAQQAQRIQCGECLRAEQRTAARQIRRGKSLRAKWAKRKWSSVWAGLLSLSR